MSVLHERGQIALNAFEASHSYIFHRHLTGQKNMALVQLAWTLKPTPKTAWWWAVVGWNPDHKMWRVLGEISTPGRAGADPGEPTSGYYRVWCLWQQPNAPYGHRFEGHANGEITARDIMVAILEHQ